MNFSCDLGSVNMDPTQLAQFNSTNDSKKNHESSDGVKTEVTSFRDEYEWSFANIPFNEAPIATAPIAEAYDKYSIMHSPLAVTQCLSPTIPFHDDDDNSLLSLPADTLASATSIHPQANISYIGASVTTPSPSVNVSQGPSPSKVNIAVSSSTAVSPATDITTIPGNITPPRADHDHFPPEQLWATSSVEGGSTITSPTSVATGGLSPPYHDISTSPYPDFDAKAYIAAGVDPSSHPLANSSYGASASMPLGSVVAPVTMRVHNTGSPALDAHGKMLGLGSTNPYRHSPTLALSTLLPQASQGLATAHIGTSTGMSTAQMSSRSYSYSYNPSAPHDTTTNSTSASTSTSTTTPAVSAGTGATHAPMSNGQGNGAGAEHGMGTSGSGMGNNATYGAMPGYLFSTGNSMYNHGNNAGMGVSTNTNTGYSSMVPSAAPSAVPSAVTTPNPGVNGMGAQRHAGMGAGMGVGTNGVSMNGVGGYMYGANNGMGVGTLHTRPTTHSSFFDPSTNTHAHMYGQNSYATPQNTYNAHQGGYTMGAGNGSVSGMGYRSSFADGTSTAASLASHRHSFGDVTHTTAAHHSPSLAHSHHRSAFDVNPGTAPSVAAVHRSSFADGTVTALPNHMLGTNGMGMGMGVDGGMMAGEPAATNTSTFTEPPAKKNTTTASTGNRRSTRAVKAPPSTQDSIYAASASSPLTDTPLRGPSKNKKGVNATNSTAAAANTSATAGMNDGAGMGYQGMGGMGAGGKGMSMGMGHSQSLRMQGMAHMGMGNLNMSTTMQMHNHMHPGMANSINANNGMGVHAEMASDNSPQGEEDSSSDYDEGEWESTRKYSGSARSRGTTRHSSAITEASLQAAYNAANDSDIDEFLESKKGQRLSKKDRNKLSAMKYRKKRKMFVVELEDKVEQLETHIQQQTDQISFLQGENGRLLALLASVGIVDPGPAKKVKPTRKESTGTGSTSVKKRAVAGKDNGRDTTVTLGSSTGTGAAAGGKGVSRNRNSDTSTLASGSAVLFILFSLFMFLTPMLLDVSDMDPKPPVIHALTPNALSPSGISQEFPIMSNFPVQSTNSVSAATLLREVDMLVHDIDAYSTGKNSNARNSENSHRELVHQSRILLMHLREELDHEVSQANEGANDGDVSDTDTATPLTLKVHNDSAPASNDVAESTGAVPQGVEGKNDSMQSLRDGVASSSPFLFSTWFLDITAWIQSANMLAKWLVICWHVFVPIVVVIFAEKVGLALFIRQLLGIARCEDNNGYCITAATHTLVGDVAVDEDVEVDGTADEADEEDVRDRESYVSQYTKSRRSPYSTSREYSANVNCNDVLSMDSPFASLCSSPDCSNCSVSDSELAGVPSRRRVHHHGIRHDPIRIATGVCDADDYLEESIKGSPEMTNPDKSASECAYSMKKLPEPQAVSGGSPTNKWSESSETTDEEETWKEYTLWDSDSDDEQEGEKSPETINKNTLTPENYHEHCIVAKV